MPLHEHFHVSVTSCQRAEVKRVLHCDATTSADMDALLSKNSLLPVYFLPTTTNFYSTAICLTEAIARFTAGIEIRITVITPSARR